MFRQKRRRECSIQKIIPLECLQHWNKYERIKAKIQVDIGADSTEIAPETYTEIGTTQFNDKL